MCGRLREAVPACLTRGDHSERNGRARGARLKFRAVGFSEWGLKADGEALTFRFGIEYLSKGHLETTGEECPTRAPAFSAQSRDTRTVHRRLAALQGSSAADTAARKPDPST